MLQCPGEQDLGGTRPQGIWIGSGSQRGPAPHAAMAEISQRLCGEVLHVPRGFPAPLLGAQALPPLSRGCFNFGPSRRKEVAVLVGVLAGLWLSSPSTTPPQDTDKGGESHFRDV